MYNTGNSSKNVTGASIVDGSVETVDIADDAVTADKLAAAVNTDIATGVTANTTANAALPKAGGTITGSLTSEAANTFGKSTSAVTTTVKSSTNWNYPELKVQRNSSNTANFKAISFMLDGDSDSNTDLYGYPNIIINTDSAPTTSDTSAAENASMTINVPNKFMVGTNGTERVRVLSAGGVCVGNTVVNPASGFATQAGIGLNPNGEIQAARNGATAMQLGRFTSTGGVLAFRYAGTSVGTISVDGSSTSYGTSSDYRLKENVVPMIGSINRLKALKPSKFNFIADADKTVDGFLAHEAGEVVPECATGTKDAMKIEEYVITQGADATFDDEGNEVTPAIEAIMGEREVADYQGIDQSKLVPLLVSALQEAIARIETLENA